VIISCLVIDAYAKCKKGRRCGEEEEREREGREKRSIRKERRNKGEGLQCQKSPPVTAHDGGITYYVSFYILNYFTNFGNFTIVKKILIVYTDILIL